VEEYLFTRNTDTVLMERAKRKLLLLGLSEQQIRQIAAAGRAPSAISVYSPYEGYVLFGPDASAKRGMEAAESAVPGMTGMPAADAAKAVSVTASGDNSIREGMYIDKDQSLCWINDLKDVWGIIAFSRDDERYLSKGQEATVTSELMPGQTLGAPIQFIEQVYREGQKFTQARVYLPNPSGRLRLNSLISAAIPARAGALTVPAGSIYYLGGVEIAWVRTGMTKDGNNIFQARMVKTGRRNEESVEVTEGLTASDFIARDAGYLADSETIIDYSGEEGSGGGREDVPQASAHTGHSLHTGHSSGQMGEMQPDTIMLTARDEQFANIAVDTVRVKHMAEYTTLLGTTALDERKVSVITARIRGRVEHLFARTPQQWVKAGEALYTIYSEELLSYENEFVNALQQQSHFSDTKQLIGQVVEGARKKLLLLGVAPGKVLRMEKDHAVSASDTFYAPVSGTLTELNVTEGQYVENGTLLFQIADLTHIWIEAQMYPHELQWLVERPIVTAAFDAYPGRMYSATPVFDNPSIEQDQKISLVRFRVANDDRLLKPGMMAYVNIKRNEKMALAVPRSSLLMGDMVTVWVRTGKGVYESRMIGLGIRNRQEVEVTSGLKEGDVVVTSGAFLLNSAMILKKGAGMGGMKM